MEILKQIQAKMKAIAVIESCENCFHYDVAENYINRYFIQFNDKLGRVELSNELQKIKLKNLGNEEIKD